MESLSARALDRLSSGGALLIAYRLSLLLALAAVCTAPGQLPVAGLARGPIDPGTKDLAALRPG